DDMSLLIWDKSESLNGITILPQYGLRSRGLKIASSSLIQVSLLDRRILSVEKNGLVRILNPESYETEFEYRSPGMKKVIPVNGQTLVGARSRISQFSGPLVRINTTTGETVPLPDSSLLAYDLVYDPFRDELYSLSVEQKDGQTITYIKRHHGRDYEKQQPVIRYPGEDLSASLAFDPYGKKLYTSLG
ncbi:unnamed protein product, partial [marine sediment metagenome]